MTSPAYATDSTRATASDDSAPLPFAPSRQERRESEATTATAATSPEVTDDAITQLKRPHPYRDPRNPRSACHFDGLAAVEVHSIMQMLDQTSLLRLARCSRRMHADADSDASWSTQPLYFLRLSASDSSLSTRLRESLLRHLSRVEVWICPTAPPDVQALLAIPRITQISGYQTGMRLEEWVQVLSHPCTVGLTSLSITDASLGGALPVELTAQLARLTRLDTINIYPRLSHGDLLAALPTLPALTSLYLGDLDDSVDLVSLLPPVLHACARLTQLTLGRPNDGSQLFRSIFCDVKSPSAESFLSRLEYLELKEFKSIVPHIPASELNAAFEAMTGLCHLVLDSVETVDGLLPFVALIDDLIQLDIRPNFHRIDFFDEDDELIRTPGDDLFWPNTAPTAPPLEAMMETSSVQSVILYIPDDDERISTSSHLSAFDVLDPDRFTIDY